MLPDRANNKRTAKAIGVKITLIPLVCALLFAVMLTTAAGMNPQAPRDASNYRNIESNSTDNRMALPTFAENIANNSFLASLRFWEKNKNQPSAKQPAPVERNTRPRETPAAPSEVSVVNPESLPVQRPATLGTAPVPPPIPPPIPHDGHRTGVGSAPLPEWSANFEHDTNDSHRHNTHDRARPSAPSHMSYSFDARDWIELFPVQHAQSNQQEIHEDTSPVMVQATSLHTQTPTALAPQTNEGGHNNWDGQATTLATIASLRHEINMLQQEQTVQSFAPPAAAPSMEAPHVEVLAEKPQIDLSPSYQRRLPYVQTCGVVVVQANFPLTEIASVLDEINMLQHDLTRYIGVPAANEKIELCLFKDQQSYIDFLKEFFPRAPRDRRALYVKLDNKPGTLMVQRSKDFEVDLRHEMTHAIVHASIAKMPIWLDEGLAKYFEVPPEDRAHNHPYMAQIRNNARLGMVPSLDRLARLETIDDMGTKEYRDSWAWTHFLIHRSPETHRLLAAYLQMLAVHSSTEGAAARSDSALARAEGKIAEFFTERIKPSSIPSLKPYLDEIMPNQRESFREHFGTTER